MKDCAAHNRVYRVVWNRARCVWMVVGELAKGLGKGSGRKKHSLRGLLMLIPLSLFSSLAMAAPTGGAVTSGTGTISQVANTTAGTNTTTINQSTQNLSISWQTFNVGTSDTVNFVQPSSSALAVNRIADTQASQILGHINANGQIYLINPNGIVFGSSAQVNVGGLVASTLDTTDNSNFSGTGTGSIVNNGTINATQYVALLANREVYNGGSIVTAQMGTVAMGAGDDVSLTFSGNSLVKMQVNKSTIRTLVANGQLIQADGGLVVMTAGAKDTLLASVVNNDGIVQAQTVNNVGGTIQLLGGAAAGTVGEYGKLDASAPNGGNGGSIETSARRVVVSQIPYHYPWITTKAASGLNGTWKIDSGTFSIGRSYANISGPLLDQALGNANVSIQSTSGDINVNDFLRWSANTLTLNAQRNINFNGPVEVLGTAGLALDYGQGSTNGIIGGVAASYGFNSLAVFAPGTSLTTQLGSSGTPINWGIVDSAASLQAINNNLSGHYVVGSNFDASATSTWNAGAGFTPIGNSTNMFTGVFDGLGHTITGLYIKAPTRAGLFADASGAILRNIGLVGGNVSGWDNVGALVGYSSNTLINNAYATGSVSGSTNVGGLVGYNKGGTVTNAHASGSVTGSGNSLGGLVGSSSGTVSNDYATGIVTGSATSSTNVGGLVGAATGGSITGSYAMGSVSGKANVGGLVGWHQIAISNDYATGSVTGSGDYVGGLTGYSAGAISGSYATGSVTGGNDVGGLAGYSSGITGSRASGGVTGASNVGGLVGSSSGSVTGDYATGSVTGSGSNVGGLAGLSSGTVSNDYATGNVSGAKNNVGGLVGKSTGTVSNDYAIGSVSGYSGIGGLVGLNGSNNATTASISGSYATGSATGNVDVGGLVGANVGSVSTSYATGAVTGLSSGAQYWAVGGLVGYSAGTISESYASGNVTGVNQVGGLLGWNAGSGSVANAYATGSVTGSADVGGLVALNSNSGNTITDSYATGMVSGNSAVGGLVGSNRGGSISNSYWDSTTDTNPAANNGIGTGMSTTALASALPAGFSTSVWANAGNRTTPYLLVDKGVGPISGSVYVGSDTGTTPYGLIMNMAQLQSIGGNLSGNYALGTNLTAPSGSLFTPLGNTTTGFIGTFDGLGHTISNLRPGGASDGYVGLFGVVRAGGVIRDIGLLNSYVQAGGNGIGTLAGYSAGTITGAYASGYNISGRNVGNGSNEYGIGGLVGVNAGIVSDAYTTGQVRTPFGHVGGLVGDNKGSITGSYANANVFLFYSGASIGGGLVGYNTGTISDAYATGKVLDYAGYIVGGLVGENGAGGTISNVYSTAMVGVLRPVYNSATHQTTYQMVSGYNLVARNYGTISNGYWDTMSSNSYPTSAYGTGLTDAQMHQGSNFTGFDFNKAWVNYDGYTTPLLRSFMTPLTVTANATKTYDGTAISGLSGLTYSLANVDTSHLLGTPVYSTTNMVNAGTYNNVTVSGLYSDQQGYIINTAAGTETINKAELTATGTQVYNGTTSFGASNLTVDGVNGETFTVSGTGMLASKNVQTNQQLADASGLILSGNNGALLSNYNVLAPVDTSVSVTPASLTLDAVSATKGYDGTTASTGTVTATGLVGGDTLSGLSEVYQSKNVLGTNGSTLLVGGYTINDGNGGNNYIVTTGTAIGTITPATLTATGTQVYNGTTGFTGSNLAVSGVNGETFTASGNGILASRNVQTNQQLADTTGLSLTENNGALLSNYNALTPADTSVSVTPAPLTLTASSDSRVYDGTTGSTGTVSISGLATGTAGDAVLFLARDSVTGLSQSFASKNVMGTNGSTLNVNGGYTINDGNGGHNYTVTTVSAAGTITPASLTLNAGSDSKVYDGTTSSTGTVTSSGLVGSDTVSGLAQSYASKNVLGTGGSTLEVSGYTVNDGNGGNNYTVSTNTAAGTITPASLTLDATSATKVYDGTTSSTGTVTSSGLVGGDTVSGLSQSFESKNVMGTNGSTLLVSSYTVNDGNGGNNYTVSTNTVAGTITPAALTLDATSATKVYDGMTSSTGTVGATGLVGGDTVTGLSQSYTSKNVMGTNGSTLQVNGGYTVNDGNGGNNYTVSTNTAAGTITPASLTVSGETASNKVYDATTNATLTGGTVKVFGTDDVTLSESGQFATKNVGTAIPVTATDTISGADAGNYTLVEPTGLSADITPATLTYTANATTATAAELHHDLSLSGTVTGFKGSDTLANATKGELEWEADVERMRPGSYAINGEGLTANFGNYVFVQAASNATALTIQARRPVWAEHGEPPAIDPNPTHNPLPLSLRDDHQGGHEGHGRADD